MLSVVLKCCQSRQPKAEDIFPLLIGWHSQSQSLQLPRYLLSLLGWVVVQFLLPSFLWDVQISSAGPNGLTYPPCAFGTVTRCSIFSTGEAPFWHRHSAARIPILDVSLNVSHTPTCATSQTPVNPHIKFPSVHCQVANGLCLLHLAPRAARPKPC